MASWGVRFENNDRVQHRSNTLHIRQESRLDHLDYKKENYHVLPFPSVLNVANVYEDWPTSEQGLVATTLKEDESAYRSILSHLIQGPKLQIRP